MAKKTIMIIDDQPEILELDSITLQKEGYDVVPVEDAESGLELLGLELLKHPGLSTAEHVFHEATAVRCHNVLGCEQVARHAGVYVGVGVAVVLLLGVRNEVAGELEMLGYGVLRYSPQR